MVRPKASLPVVDLKNYEIAEKTIQFFQVSHMIGKPKFVNAEEGENLKIIELNSWRT